jgi:hypothetical protein
MFSARSGFLCYNLATLIERDFKSATWRHAEQLVAFASWESSPAPSGEDAKQIEANKLVCQIKE